MQILKTKMLIAASALILGFTTISCKDNDKNIDVIKPDLTFFALSNGNKISGYTKFVPFFAVGLGF